MPDTSDIDDVTTPTQSPAGALSFLSPMTVGNPDAANRYLAEHGANADKFEKQYEDVMARRQSQIDKANEILNRATEALKARHEGTAAGMVNLPLLALGAGMMGPGNFGDQVGRGLQAMGTQIQRQRMSDDEYNKAVAQLALRQGQLSDLPLRDQAAVLKSQQLGEQTAQRQIEQAEIRTAPARMKAMLPKISGNTAVYPDGTIRNLVTGFTYNPTNLSPTANGATPTVTGDDTSKLDTAWKNDNGKYNEKALEGYDPTFQNYVKMLVKGEVTLPGTRGDLKPDVLQALQVAKAYDPTFDSVNYNKRAQAVKAWSTGKQGDAQRFANTTFGHMFELYQDAAAMDNFQYPLLNKARNYIADERGKSLTSAFETHKAAVVEELQKFLRAGTGSDAGAKVWQERINAAQSPEQLQATLEGLMTLMNKQLSSMANQKSEGFDRKFTTQDLIAPDERDALSFILNNPLTTEAGRKAAMARHAQTMSGLAGKSPTVGAAPVPETSKPKAPWEMFQQ